MADWNETIASIIQQYPFLQNLGVSTGDNDSSDTLPDLLKICIAAATRTKIDPTYKLAMVLPRLDTIPLWIAYCTVLTAIKNDFASNLNKPAPLTAGSIVLVDKKHIARYLGENDKGYHIEMLNGSVPKHSPLYASTYISKSQGMRLQPVETDRPLSQIMSIRKPQIDLLDYLLDIESYGNLSNFMPQVILVTKVGKCSKIIQQVSFATTCKHPEINLCDHTHGILEWGIIKKDGTIGKRSNGQVVAPPLLLLASDMLAVRKYLRANKTLLPLVILDGSVTFTKLDLLDNVLDEGCSVFGCVAYNDSEILKQLSDRRFDIWTWSRDEIHKIQANESKRRSLADQKGTTFAPLRKSFYNYGRNDVYSQNCTSTKIEAVAQALDNVVSMLARNQDESRDVVHSLYSCLLSIAQRVRRWVDESDVLHLINRLHKIRDNVNSNGLWMSEKALESVLKLLDILQKAGIDDVDKDMDKIATLRRIFMESSGENVVVVVSGTNEINPVEKFWHQFIRMINANVRFMEPQKAAFLESCDHLVICGWLGKDKMRPLVDGCIGMRVTLLLYPFEQKWLAAFMRRWNRSDYPVMSAVVKSKLLNAPTPECNEEYEEAIDDTSQLQPTLDIVDFELSMNRYRNESLVCKAQLVSEEMTDAYFVSFASGYYAFMTESHKLPVVTDLFNEINQTDNADDNIPRKAVADLQVGDYVIFRSGLQGDIIRELADKGLKMIGKSNSRITAALWKKALRDFVDARKNGYTWKYNSTKLDELVVLLQDAGISTSSLTITNWVFTEEPIGPKAKDSIEKIIHATGSIELLQHLSEVKTAITEVRGAHLQASSFLIKKLYATLPDELALAEMSDCFEIDMEDLGRVIVLKIEDICAKPNNVAWSQVNLLLQDNEWS